VVSNMMTRSFSDLGAVVIGRNSFWVVRCWFERWGLVISREPLSAQAQTAQTALRGR
jgi:hypothetical protein